MTDYSKVPTRYMEGAVRRYIESGIPGGSFLTALFSNDLIEAFVHADADNAEAMRDWTRFLYNEVPRDAWGSPDIVKDWIKGGGASNE